MSKPIPPEVLDCMEVVPGTEADVERLSPTTVRVRETVRFPQPPSPEDRIRTGMAEAAHWPKEPLPPMPEGAEHYSTPLGHNEWEAEVARQAKELADFIMNHNRELHDIFRVRHCLFNTDTGVDANCPFCDDEYFECAHPSVPPDVPFGMMVGPSVIGYFDSVPAWCPLRKRPALVRLDDADGCEG